MARACAIAPNLVSQLPAPLDRHWVEGIEKAISQDTIIQLEDDGKILGFRFPKNAGAEHRNWIRTIALAFQFIKPIDAREAWTTEEDDQIGRSQNSYSLLAADFESPGKNSINKDKVRYVTTAHDVSDTISIDSHGLGRFDAAVGWLESAEFHDAMKYSVAGATVLVSQDMSGSIKLRDSTRTTTFAVADADWAGPWAPVGGSGEDLETKDELIETILQQMIAGTSPQQLINDLIHEAQSAEPNRAALFGVQQKLASHIKIDPALAEVLWNLIRGNINETTASALFAALGQAGTDRAQQVLARSLASQDMQDERRVAAAFATFQLEKPNAALLDSLSVIIRDPAISAPLLGTGLLALGAMASRLPASGSEPAIATPQSEVLRQLSSMESECRRRGVMDAWLAALGNTRSPEIVEIVSPLLTAAEDQVRAQAIKALREVVTIASTAKITDRALNDRSEWVRLAAVDALAERDSREVLETLQRIAASDADEGVRQRARNAVEKIGASK